MFVEDVGITQLQLTICHEGQYIHLEAEQLELDHQLEPKQVQLIVCHDHGNVGVLFGAHVVQNVHV